MSQQVQVMEGYRLSLQQKRSWAMPDLGAAQCVIRLEGKLDMQRLVRALEQIVDQHGILRTSFSRLPGIKFPVQVINKPGLVSWRFSSYSACNPQQVEVLAAEERRLRDEQQQPVRFALCAVAPGAHLLVVTLSSLCADTKTMTNLVTEISRAYEGNGAEEAVQYLQYAEWQNELLAEETPEAAQEYWREVTQRYESVALLRLPLEPQPGVIDFKPRSVRRRLEAEVTSAAAVMMQKLETTPRVFWLSCWLLLLQRLTGAERLATGCVFDGRVYEELRAALGPYARALPVGAEFKGAVSFTELCRQVERGLEESEEWQHYYRAKETNGFGFEYVEAPGEQAGAVSVRLERWSYLVEANKVRLRCEQWSTKEVAIELGYDAALYEREEMERLAERYEEVVRAVVQEEVKDVRAVAVVGAAERRQLIEEWSAGAAVTAETSSIVEMFEAAVSNAGERMAVESEEGRLSYDELNERANRLGRYLRAECGVQSEEVVAVALGRGLHQLVAVLGVLKAGGAYLPLDVALPEARLEYQIRASRAQVLITTEKLIGSLPAFEGRFVCLDRDRESIGNQAVNNLNLAVEPDQLAYVIYTSGSTGNPKGVAVTHRGLANYTRFICDKLKLADSRALNFATVSTLAADLGNTSIFPSLASGGSLHILSYEVAMDGGRFAEYFSKHQIDVLKIVPSHMGALLLSTEVVNALSKMHLICGGEALPIKMVEQISDSTTDCHVINHYGPTETTVGSLTFDTAENDDYQGRAATVPIGRPIANTEVYILDAHSRVVPAGMPGDLYIGGAGVARGYLHDAAQTADRFVPHPFSENGERLYRTGDLVRYLPDGSVEFLGRVDHQVKIRGFRIEPAEIEAALKQHPALRDAVVMAREDEPDHKRLVTYIVPHKNAQPNVSELRNFLQARLPEYMVPTSFVMLKSLPLTANGKVDRAALPAPDQSRPDLLQSLETPRNAVEEVLAEIWSRVLGIEQVGIHDNFFELGGDSILSLQIVVKAGQAGLQVTPQQLFEHPTIADLASVAGSHQRAVAPQGLVSGELPLTPIQHWFFSLGLARPEHWNQSLLLELRQALDPALLPAVLEHLLRHHDALRLRFEQTASGWRQFHASPTDELPFSRIEISSLLSDAEQAETIASTADALQRSLHLEHGPVVRMAYFEVEGAPAKLLLIIHHLVVDGVSWRILLEDLETAYRQLSRGEAVTLPAKTTSFQQWAERLAAYGKSEAVLSQLQYWRGKQEQLRRAGRLPVDEKRGANTEGSAASVVVGLSVEETTALLQEVPGVYHTQINDVLVTGLGQALSEWSGQELVALQLEGHGREALFAEVELTRTVGWLTTHYPVVLKIDMRSGVGETLKRVKEELRAVPGRGLGYGVLRYLSGEAEVQEWDESEVKFNYLGQLDQVLDEEGLYKEGAESSGTVRDENGERRQKLEVIAYVRGGQLHVEWSYSEKLHQRATIEAVAQNFIATLRAIITHCQSADSGGYTPSDFPEANLGQNDLDTLIARIGRA